MPEGHSVHRIANQLRATFAGRRITASSPQGRFADGAARINGTVLTDCFAVGKQMFAAFDNGLWLRVHLGIYGAWDFWGEVTAVDYSAGVPSVTLPGAEPIAAAAPLIEHAGDSGRIGQTGEYAAAGRMHTVAQIVDADGEDSALSIGAPRLRRMAEHDTELATSDQWPPEIVGTVRLRLLTDRSCADLRGPTVCELLDDAGVERVLDRLGPDPLVGDPNVGEERFVENAVRRRVAIGQLLMDQAVVAGIGNIYRAEILFRAAIDPHIPGNEVPEAKLREIWRDWTRLLPDGVRVGRMMTIDGLTGEAWELALADVAHRHWVYGRAGEPCRRCGANVQVELVQGRKLYWCPGCQR